MEYRCYLSGPMSGWTPKHANKWRQYVIEHLPENIHCLSPLRGQVKLNENRSTIKSEYKRSLFCNSKAITDRDKFDVFSSDIMLVNLLESNKVSIGTMIEIGWASAKGVPIVVVMDKKNVHQHPIVKELASFLVKDLKTGIRCVRSILDV